MSNLVKGHPITLGDKRGELAAMPSDLWWTDPNFYLRAKEERARMARSKFGQLKTAVFGPDEAAYVSPTKGARSEMR